jgi:hypothetical protein
MRIDKILECSVCHKRCRLSYKESLGPTRVTVVRHSCGAELAVMVHGSDLECYEMGDDRKFYRSESFILSNFWMP